MSGAVWSAGVDLGGTKIQVIQVNAFGTIGERVLIPTDVIGGPAVIEKDIAEAINELKAKAGSSPSAIGLGVAGQIDASSGVVKFAPNLKWSNIPLEKNLKRIFGIPVIIINDVRAATWGEWLHGAGKGVSDLLCVFIGTGVGGGIISNSKILTGFGNTAGEIGHMSVNMTGPQCTCGNIGCMEAFAGGWAIRKRAHEAIRANRQVGELLLEKANGNVDDIKGRHIYEAASLGDPLSCQIIEDAIKALAAGTAGLINAIGPQKVIFGGGIIEGNPYLIDVLNEKIRLNALSAATEQLEIVQAKLHNDAGAIGAGALANRTFLK